MNTKKRIASRTMLAVSAILCIPAIWVVFYGFCRLILDLQRASEGYILSITTIAVGLLLLGWTLCGMNRVCCLVWIEDGALHRRGLLGGYHRSCASEDVQQIAAVPQGRGGRYLFVQDNHPGVYVGAKKDSFIYLEDTPENRRFLTAFCRQAVHERNIFGQ